ncbi:MAG: hypothetical protein JNL48_06775 [Acidobacteria bacterium]|nr:hypothetical protein [Acidobacteriota bacterium]
MIAPGARTVGSFALIAILSGCTTAYLDIPIETPIQPKLDVRPFSRVFVAGFVSAGTDDVDGNLETVRLLRSQLRNKGTLRVIDADALALGDLVAGENGAAGAAPATAPATAAAEVSDDMAFAAYEKVFADKEYWKKVGEEMQQPLIVTGTILFRTQQRSGFVQRERETFDALGRRVVQPERTYMERKGFILRPSFIFIDGRTGETLHTETFREEILYNANQTTPPLSSFFELMDRLLPSFLNTLSAQKVRGSRTLLK